MATLAEAFRIALTHQQAGRLLLAADVYQRIIQADPQHFEALVNLGNVLQVLGRLSEAATCYQRALQVQPDCVEAHNNLGCCLHSQHQLDAAMACFERALALRPDYPDSLNNVGNVLRDQGRRIEAMAWYQRAVEKNPQFAYAHNNLGDVLRELRRYDEAVASYRRALEFSPQTASIWNNLGATLREQERGPEAAACFRQAIKLQPNYAGAYTNLGNCAKDLGDLDEAVDWYRRAVELQPDNAVAHSNLLYALYYSPRANAQALAEAHARWTRQHALPLAGSRLPHPNDRSPERRLRVGYVSPDLYGHPVGLFLLPVLQVADRQAFELFAYASVLRPDALTDHFRQCVDVWRDVACVPDDQLTDLIRQDQIDILVDLSGHSAGNRMLVFARKPAPVQVTWLAFCGSTGLDTMDYRLTDPYLDPPGIEEPFYTEESYRLPETYWCYRPATDMPPLGPVPALASGQVTFGCLNNFCKVNATTLDAWGRLLAVVPNSRLLLHCRPGSHRERVSKAITAHGVAAARLTFVDLLPTSEYHRTYQQIDIALDPFPYGGATTSCDALWMGVPVVSLAGERAVGRAGLSILSNLGLADLVGHDVEQYVAIAARLAGDLPRLSALRATLRQRMQQSPLMDAPRFARNLEAAYRTMWRRWCAGR